MQMPAVVRTWKIVLSCLKSDNAGVKGTLSVVGLGDVASLISRVGDISIDCVLVQLVDVRRQRIAAIEFPASVSGSRKPASRRG